MMNESSREIKNAIATYYYCDAVAAENTNSRRLNALCKTSLNAYHDMITTILQAHKGLTLDNVLNAFSRFDWTCAHEKAMRKEQEAEEAWNRVVNDIWD